MARSSTSDSDEVQAGDDNGGLVGGQGADDIAPDDRGGVAGVAQANGVGADDHGGLLGGHGADDVVPAPTTAGICSRRAPRSATAYSPPVPI
jgi:hypothetical protein